MMVTIYVSLLLGQLILSDKIDSADTTTKSEMIDYRDISTRVKITGKLGRPLGALMNIRGHWVKVSRPKPAGPIFMVDSVDGKPLKSPAEFTQVQAIAGPAKDFDTAAGQAWELRGVKTGGFQGFSAEVWAEVGPVASRVEGGFVTKFYYISARRLSDK